VSTVLARAQEGRETQTRATAGGREEVGRRRREKRRGFVEKLNAGNDDESRMRAKRSIFDSTRLRYSSVFCSVASRVVTINLYIYINASSRSRRFYVVGRSRRFVGHAASTQKNPTRAYPRGVARTSSHTPHFLFPCSNSLSFCHKAHPVRVRDDVLLVLGLASRR